MQCMHSGNPAGRKSSFALSALSPSLSNSCPPHPFEITPNIAREYCKPQEPHAPYRLKPSKCHKHRCTNALAGGQGEGEDARGPLISHRPLFPPPPPGRARSNSSQLSMPTRPKILVSGSFLPLLLVVLHCAVQHTPESSLPRAEEASHTSTLTLIFWEQFLSVCKSTVRMSVSKYRKKSTTSDFRMSHFWVC